MTTWSELVGQCDRLARWVLVVARERYRHQPEDEGLRDLADELAMLAYFIDERPDLHDKPARSELELVGKLVSLEAALVARIRGDDSNFDVVAALYLRGMVTATRRSIYD